MPLPLLLLRPQEYDSQAKMTQRFHSVCKMKEYANKSPEELRLEDMVKMSKCKPRPLPPLLPPHLCAGLCAYLCVRAHPPSLQCPRCLEWELPRRLRPRRQGLGPLAPHPPPLAPPRPPQHSGALALPLPQALLRQPQRASASGVRRRPLVALLRVRHPPSPS